MKKLLAFLLLLVQSYFLQGSFPNNMQEMLNYDARCLWIVYSIDWGKQELVQKVGCDLQQYNARFDEINTLMKRVALPLLFDVYCFKFAEYLFKYNHLSFEQNETLKKASRIDQVTDVIEQFMKNKVFLQADKHKFMELASDIVFADIFALIKK